MRANGGMLCSVCSGRSLAFWNASLQAKSSENWATFDSARVGLGENVARNRGLGLSPWTSGSCHISPPPFASTSSTHIWGTHVSILSTTWILPTTPECGKCFHVLKKNNKSLVLCNLLLLGLIPGKQTVPLLQCSSGSYHQRWSEKAVLFSRSPVCFPCIFWPNFMKTLLVFDRTRGYNSLSLSFFSFCGSNPVPLRMETLQSLKP